MALNVLEYHWAETIDDALLLLSRTDIKTVPLAGGTYLLGQTDDTIQAVVDLRDLQLAYITEDAQGIHLGAMTTLQGMADADTLKNVADGLLAKAALASSFSRLIRNSATLGGTLVTGAASQADLLTVLAVMDAEAVVRSGSQTQVTMGGAFSNSGIVYKGKRERRIPFMSLAQDRRPNELIIEIRVPRVENGAGGAFQRVGRAPSDIALLNAAALVDVQENVYRRVRLAIGGANMEPMRLYTLEQQLEGQPINVGAQFNAPTKLIPIIQSGMADFRPPSDFRAGSAYRRAAGMSMIVRVLEEAANAARRRGQSTEKGE